MRKSAGCNECTHPTCRYSLEYNGICACYICKQGIFVLDVTSMPKYRLACNKFVDFQYSEESDFNLLVFILDVHLF